MTPLISIIIPVFNTENYLSKCLDSVLSQSYIHLEVIIVDDGSFDNSGKICDEYAIKDKRIKVIHKENGGVSSSRNVGIEKANGEWLMFVDSDDELSHSCIETLSKGFDTKYDMIIGGYELTDEAGNTTYTINRNDVFVWDVNQCLRDVYRSAFFSYNGYCFNRLFRHRIIKANNLCFNETIYSREDGLFLVQYLLKCSNLAYCTLESIYKYRQNNNNATSSFKLKYNSKIISGMVSHLICIKCIQQDTKDKTLLKYAKKGLITSYKFNVSQLKKFKIKDYSRYIEITKMLLRGVTPFEFVFYGMEDFLPVLLHPVTSMYRQIVK